MPYIISKNGTFGIVKRYYVSQFTGEKCVVIQHGPFNWNTPVLEKDTHILSSSYESLAMQEAINWLKLYKILQTNLLDLIRGRIK